MKREKQLMLLHMIQQRRLFELLEHLSEILWNRYSHAKGRPCVGQDCVGCGFDGASAMSSERVGAAALVKSKAPLADYFHCTMHSFNLSASQSSKIVEIRHCFDCIHEAVYSAKCAIWLENVIK